MSRGRHLQLGIICFLIVTILCSPVTIALPGLNPAFAAEEPPSETEGPPSGQKVNDPYEWSNRKVFDFNDHLYFYVLKPAAVAYSTVMPTDLRTGIKNGFHNLVYPARFINCVLQAKPDKALTETLRFVINSTTGLVGMIDLAQANFGLASYDADFGQTLALWGLGSGPYLVVPLLGPSDARDLFGFGVDSAMNPLFWLPYTWWASFTVQTGKYVNSTSLQIGQYEELKKASLDPYVATREGYVQYREHLISK